VIVIVIVIGNDLSDPERRVEVGTPTSHLRIRTRHRRLEVEVGAGSGGRRTPTLQDPQDSNPNNRNDLNTFSAPAVPPFGNRWLGRTTGRK
jgi:hypothetical protein